MSSTNNKSKKTLQSKKDVENGQYNRSIKLYGMTLEQYHQGKTIHSQCFDQLKKFK